MSLTDVAAPFKAGADLVDCMSAKDNGLGGQVQLMKKMAEAVGPMVETFDSVLRQPNLNNYDATLNNVPVVGLKGNYVMYLRTQSAGAGIEDVWAVFSLVPEGAKVNSSDAIHFFPYKGDFCMAIGTSIWRKRHHSRSNPEILRAISNWPKLYGDNWEKIGDRCLPNANLRSIIPLATLSATGNQIKFNLLTLGQDGALRVLDGDDIAPTNAFSTLKNVSNDEESKKIQLQKVAYWNGKIVAYDNTGYTWNLTPNIEARTFEAKDKVAVETITELTATNISPVGVQQDGYLYKRIVETSQDTSNKQSNNRMKWSRWVKQDGVTHLGVASPGVLLGLEMLIKSLKDRYLSSQSALYPVVDKTHSFAITHDTFLRQMSDSASVYATNENQPTKQRDAIKEAKKHVRQAKIWAGIMRAQMSHSKRRVNFMSQDNSSFLTDLNQQLTRLRDAVALLESLFKTPDQVQSRIDATFWASISVAVPGLGLAVLAQCAGVETNSAIGVGGLFVGGLIGARNFEEKPTELTKVINEVKNQLQVLKKEMEEIKSIASNLKDLEDIYGKLDQFWGKMFNSAAGLQAMDDATALQIGSGLLEDSASIIAARAVTGELSKACGTYLAILNRIGIRNPSDDADSEDADS